MALKPAAKKITSARTKAMAKKATVRKSARSAPKKPPTALQADVDGFVAALKHPMEAEIQALRKIIRSADKSIQEGIKWNAPSYFTSEHFATFHLRGNDAVQIILHLGAKKRDTTGLKIADPESLLQWLGKDRAAVKFRSVNDIQTKKAALSAILRQWIRAL